MQGQKHETEANRDAAKIAIAGLNAEVESQQACDEKNGRNRSNVERKNLNDQCRPDIGPEHDCQSRHQIDEPARCEGRHEQASRGAALKKRGHSDPGQKG